HPALVVTLVAARTVADHHGIRDRVAGGGVLAREARGRRQEEEKRSTEDREPAYAVHPLHEAHPGAHPPLAPGIAATAAGHDGACSRKPAAKVVASAVRKSGSDTGNPAALYADQS